MYNRKDVLFLIRSPKSLSKHPWQIMGYYFSTPCFILHVKDSWMHLLFLHWKGQQTMKNVNYPSKITQHEAADMNLHYIQTKLWKCIAEQAAQISAMFCDRAK